MSMFIAPSVSSTSLSLFVLSAAIVATTTALLRFASLAAAFICRIAVAAKTQDTSQVQTCGSTPNTSACRFQESNHARTYNGKLIV